MGLLNQFWRMRSSGRLAACATEWGCIAMLCCGVPSMHADASTAPHNRAAHKAVVLSPWEQAEQGREAFEATPEANRTRAAYTRVMDAYRAIYHANPADVHAAAAVNAVAELLAEQGRSLHDAKSLEAAVGQYDFVRKQYPASSLGTQALLAEGRIEQDDLHDAAAAKEKYKLLLKQRPKSEQAEEAQAGLASLKQGTGNREQETADRGQRTARESSVASSQPLEKNAAAQLRGDAVPQPAHRDENAASGAKDAGKDLRKPATGSDLPAMAQTSGVVGEPAHHDKTPLEGAPGTAPADVDGPGVIDASSTAERRGKRAVVSGIRHWSTATYTRVAIDLGDNVTYEAARVPNPDRIYFDLHGTKLASELVGKSFAVTDDGFLKKVRAAQYTDDVTRVVLDVNDVTEYSAFLLPNPYRLIIDIHGGKKEAQRSAGKDEANAPVNASPADVPAPHTAAAVKATQARPVPNSVATRNAGTTSEVANLSDLPGKVEATKKPTSKPISAVVSDGEIADQVAGSSGVAAQPIHHDDAATNGVPGSVVGRKKGRAKAEAANATPARAAAPMADGETSLVRALGLKIGRIVIDAGHGGHDSGTLGAGGIQEKDVVLDVALRVGKLLHDRLGAEIIYTRSDDTFIPLETRTAIANKAQADLFLSIHANSSEDTSARGVETYYLNFTSDPTALDVAARENAVSDQSIHQLSDLVKKIALKDKIAESREFASDVESSLYAGLQKGNAGLKDRGVKKAPFVVLIGANMPSILAEISFVTNPKDAQQLEQPDYRERVAESIYKGVARYEGGLSGVHLPVERAAVGQ
ncbi:MAG TPA: N-acetylmuramoyl-L-alanine amidase [Acidobacteriaceae bacterium]|nr:N-acetylmuramoyl-L-alanine amidase [Acidobacteriaceae bacterium]